MGGDRRTLSLRGASTVAIAAVALVLLAALAVFFVWPVTAILWRGIAPDGVPDPAGMLEVLARLRTQRIIGMTLAQAAIATCCAVLLGVPAAMVLYRLRFPGRSLARAAAMVPFVMPTVVVGIAFRVLVDGTVLEDSWWAIILALVFFNVPVVIRTVGTAWEDLDPVLEESAADLGARPISAFLRVTLPRLAPAIASAALVVFLFCATAFGVVLVLGGARFGTVETEIWTLTTQYLDLQGAATLSILQLVVVVGLLIATSRFRPVSELRTPSAGRAPRAGDWPVLASTAVTAILLAAPIVVLILRSLRDGPDWTLDNYLALGSLGGRTTIAIPPLAALGNSLAFGAGAAAIALAFGLAASVLLSRPARSRAMRRFVAALDGALMLPLGVSAVTVGFGFLIALDRPPLDLRTSALLVPIAQALVAVPLVIRMLLPVLRGVDPLLRDAAADLGAGPWAVLRTIDLRLVARPVVAAGGLAFAMSLGEFGATAFLSRGDQATLPVLIERLASTPGPGNFGVATAASVLLAAVVALVLGAAELGQPRRHA